MSYVLGDASSVGIRINSNNVDVGENVRIWCLRRATQQAIRVEQWKFSGRFISDDVRFLKRTVSTFNELFIKSAQISDSGDYTCVTLLGQQTETLHVSGTCSMQLYKRFVFALCFLLVHVCFLPASLN